MSDGNGDNGNGRVTLAEVKKDIQHLIDLTSKIERKLDEHLDEADQRDERITILETKMADIDKLKSMLIGGMFALVSLLLLAVIVLVRALYLG